MIPFDEDRQSAEPPRRAAAALVSTGDGSAVGVSVHAGEETGGDGSLETETAGDSEPQTLPQRAEELVLAPQRRSAARHRRLPSVLLRRRAAQQQKPSWRLTATAASVSLLVHVTLLVLCGWIVFGKSGRGDQETITAVLGPESIAADAGAAERIAILPVDALLPTQDALSATRAGPDASLIEELVEVVVSNPLDVGANAAVVATRAEHAGTMAVTPVAVPPVVTSLPAAVARSSAAAIRGSSPSVAPQPTVGVEMQGHLAGRSGAAKQDLIGRMGGTPESEAAVRRGLEWLLRHRRADGSWSLQHTHGPDCDCGEDGTFLHGEIAATGLATLCFLGAGHTHQAGDHATVVQEALAFLKQQGVSTGAGIDFRGRSVGPAPFYTHALATMALGEALAMTDDASLRGPVEGAVKFLATTQHTQGGWRYVPGMPGDTSVVGWQVMALKSAEGSRIFPPRNVLKNVDRFLGTVQGPRTGEYAYVAHNRTQTSPSMTAVGLLSRMYLGWDEGRPALRAGIRRLDQWGPDRNDMYFNYYSTQVLHHWGGAEWKRWNTAMREHLVRTQLRDGHAAGSWDVADRHGGAGGRLYMTTLAILTLEVYYRHLPLYHGERIEMPFAAGEADSAAAESSRSAGSSPVTVDPAPSQP